MHVLMLGISHHTASVELRERLALAEAELGSVCAALHGRYPRAEFAVISTCNRLEVYAARPVDAAPTGDELCREVAAWAAVDEHELGAVAVTREQAQAVGHLFRVCCGLESLVVGEAQVLGQVKRSYETAVAADTVGPVLHRVFQDAVAAAKRARTQTGIGEGRVSVGSVAVDFARQVFEDLSDKTVVGLGAGEMAKATLGHLAGLRPARVWVTSRRREQSSELAARLGLGGERGGARNWDELEALLGEADVLIASTGSREPIVDRAMMKRLMKRRRHRPLFIIDIAVPRDIAAEAGRLSNVYLYNIDDLRSVVEANAAQRREEVEACEAVLHEAVAACLRQIQHRDIGQLIRRLRNRLHELGEQESSRTRRKLAAVVGDAAAAETAEQLVGEHTHRLINKILHLPLRQLDTRATQAPLAFYAEALRQLFDLEHEGGGSDEDAGDGQGKEPSEAEQPEGEAQEVRASGNGSAAHLK